MDEAVVVEGAAGREHAGDDSGQRHRDICWSAGLRVERHVVAFTVRRGNDVEANRVTGVDLQDVGAERVAEREDVVGLVGGCWRRWAVRATARSGEEKRSKNDAGSH